jgi:hypothetical protein
MRRVVIAATLFLLPVVCPGALLDFEGLTVNTILTTEFQATDSIVFEENARVYFLGANHATSGTLGLYNGGGIISAMFMLPGNIPGVTDSVSIKGDLIPISGTVTLQAFDIQNNLLDSDVKPDSPAPATLSVSAPGIHRIAFFSQSNTVAFDDLAFNTPVAADEDALVPEPASMLLLGTGAVLLIALRRRVR